MGPPKLPGPPGGEGGGQKSKKEVKIEQKSRHKALAFPVTLSSSKNQLAGQRLTLITVKMNETANNKK